MATSFDSKFFTFQNQTSPEAQHFLRLQVGLQTELPMGKAVPSAKSELRSTRRNAPSLKRRVETPGWPSFHLGRSCFTGQEHEGSGFQYEQGQEPANLCFVFLKGLER